MPAAPSTQPTHEQLSDDSRLEKQSSPNKVETALPTSGSQTVPEESVSSSKTYSQRTLKQQNSSQQQTEVTPTNDKSANKTSTSAGSSITQDAPQTSSVAKASSPPPATDIHVKESIGLPTQGKIAQTTEFQL